MDGLDLLKKDWNKDGGNDKFSAKELLPMLHKKSSSIVKLLLYISVAELFIWIAVNLIPFFLSEGYQKKIKLEYLDDFLFGVSILSYCVILVFIYLLYKSYKSISVTDNVQRLMKSIINTRKIIRYYVLYNLLMAGISSIIGIFMSLKYDPEMSKLLENSSIVAITIRSIIAIGIIILIIWLFYKLIYGLLLKRLNRNYDEIKKLNS